VIYGVKIFFLVLFFKKGFFFGKGVDTTYHAPLQKTIKASADKETKESPLLKKQ